MKISRGAEVASGGRVHSRVTRATRPQDGAGSAGAEALQVSEDRRLSAGAREGVAARSWVWRIWSTPARRTEGLRFASCRRPTCPNDAVVAALAPDEAEAMPLAARAVIGERDLERGVDRFGARVGEEHPRQPRRRDACQPSGELEGDRMAHLEGGREVHLADLAPHRLDDLGAAMAGVDAPQPGDGVENLAPSGVQ